MGAGPHILGDLRTQPRCFKSKEYFEGRDCFVDARVPDTLVIHEEANIGWCVNLIAMTHNIEPGKFGEVSGRPIVIEKNAFIAFGATLYNCVIGEGAVVAAGAVVRSQIVQPYTMVEGNPARMCKLWVPDFKKWDWVDRPLARVSR